MLSIGARGYLSHTAKAKDIERNKTCKNTDCVAAYSVTRTGARQTRSEKEEKCCSSERWENKRDAQEHCDAGKNSNGNKSIQKHKSAPTDCSSGTGRGCFFR